jgi:RNA polymerase sigma factor (sigma-70 family)
MARPPTRGSSVQWVSEKPEAMEIFTTHLANHGFRILFVERLGWDHASGTLVADVDGQAFRFDIIAHKRGFQVIHCIADRYTLFNRRRLRALQKQLLKLAHEHIVIYSCNEPKKQVWQWAVRLADGRRIRHREHPFFSASPPLPLLSRLEKLRFTLTEEETITLVDALERVRDALDIQADLDLFVNKPRYAEQSDQLALAMKNGTGDDFHAFVLFHRPLAKWGTKRLKRWVGLDEDDAEQIGMLTIMRAAKRFRPELGFQFSTYATTSMHRDCHRLGPNLALIIRVPSNIYWTLMRVGRTLHRLDVRFGQPSGTRFLKRLSEQDPTFQCRWQRFRAATEIRSLSNLRSPEYKEALRLVAPDGNPLAEILRQSMTSEVLASAIDSLSPDDATIIRLRYGLDGEPQTLESVGVLFGVTKERIRQRQLRIEGALRTAILKVLGDLKEVASESESRASSEQTSESVSTSKTVLTDEVSPNSKMQSPHDPPEITILRLQHRDVQGGLFTHAH